MVEFENKNVSVCSLRAFILTSEGNIIGDHIYVDSTSNKDKKFIVPEGGIWICDLNDAFQNKENFVKGVKYVSEYANPKAMNKCLNLLDRMTDSYDKKTTQNYVRCISFFCEVGVWKNPSVRYKYYYHKAFPKYLKNCMDAYWGEQYDELMESLAS